MTVKELKDLLNTLPKGISQEEFDNLKVFIESDGLFEEPYMDYCGYKSEDAYDEDGNEVGLVFYFGIADENI